MSKVKLKTKFEFNAKLFKNNKVKQHLISFSKNIKGRLSVKNSGTNDILLYVNKEKAAQIHPGTKANISSKQIKHVSIGCQALENTKCRGTIKFKQDK